MRASQVFPLRLLGFGLYWAWLFLAAVSPSPIFGPIECFGLPAELCELVSRLLFIVGIFAVSDYVATAKGRRILLVICCFGGPLATVLVGFSSGVVGVAAIVLMGLVDAVIFVLWLCFFGHMKVGETALYMALSYCIGGLLCLGIQAMTGEVAVLVALALPAASGLTFYFSSKYYSTETGTPELFMEAAEEGKLPRNKPYPYLRRLGIALGCAAFAFGVGSSSLFFGSVQSAVSGPLIESACCLVLALVCIVIMLATKQTQDLCALYRAVPVILATGIVFLIFPSGEFGTLGMVFVNLGYLMFEVTALNDYCIAAKSRGLSLVRTFCSARIAITAGMLSGWILNCVFFSVQIEYPLVTVMGITIVAMAVSSTVVFTEKEVFAARKVASDQEKVERIKMALESDTNTFDYWVQQFAQSNKLSARETEIAAHLLRGRNVSYISEQLFIASGTVKTHVYNVYKKIGVHNKMELLDAFDDFKSLG